MGMRLCLLGFALAAVSCGKPSGDVVGYWVGKQDKVPVAINFQPDGTVVVKHSGKVIKRHYRPGDSGIEFVQFKGDGPELLEHTKFPILLEWSSKTEFTIGDPVKSFLPQPGVALMKRSDQATFDRFK